MAMSPGEAAAKGLGWVPENHPLYGTKGFAGYEEPAAAPEAPVPPPPGTPAPLPAAPAAAPFVPPTWAPDATRAATPAAGPMTAPVIPEQERLAAPTLGPLVDNPATGQATHDPAVELGDLLSPATAAPVAGPRSTDPAAGTAAAAPAANPLNTALKDALLKMLGQGDPTLNDPALKAQSDAFSLAQTRAKQRSREAMAGRMAQSGYLSDTAGSGAFDEGLSNLEQQQGEAEAGYNANLLGDATKQRHQELLQAAALAGNQLSDEQRLQFQKELAATSAGQFQQSFDQAAKQWGQQYGLEGQKLAETARQFDTTTQAGRDALRQQLEMFKASQAQQGKEFDVDAELKKLGINQQGALGQGDLDLRRMLGEGNLNLGLLSALFQNQQFGQGLGAQLGMYNNTSNNNFMQALLTALGQEA